MDQNKKSHLFSLDALRVLSIFIVILIHQSTTTLQVLDHNVTLAPFSLFYNQISRFAVPLLFLISGFVLELNSKNDFSYITYFKKRASRIFIPFLFWSVIYYLFSVGMKFEALFTQNFLEKLIFGDASYHLYFIPTLVIFYLLFPIFHRGIKFIQKPIVLIFISVFQIALAFQNYYVSTIISQEVMRVAVLTVGMFLLGMGSVGHMEVILKTAQKYRQQFLFLLFLIIIGIYIHVFGMTTRLSTSRFIYNQYGPLNYFYTVILSLVFVNYFEKKQKLISPIKTLAKLSFFVFFVHIIILQNLWNLLLKDTPITVKTNPFFDLISFLIVAVISTLIAFIFHKIPYASNVTG